MNRAERRRRQRAGQQTVDPETRMVASGGSRFHQARIMADLPPPEPGRHRWIVSAGYTITDDEAKASTRGEHIDLPVTRLFSFGIGCYDCELVYDDAKWRPCEGDPNG